MTKPITGNLLCIDPGQFKSGWCILDSETGIPSKVGYDENDKLLWDIKSFGLCKINEEGARWQLHGPRHIVCEWFRLYQVMNPTTKRMNAVGVGQSTFHTCRWIGRFQEAFDYDENFHLIERPVVNKYWTGRSSVKKPLVNAAMYERYGTGTCCSAKGTKKNPGALYGFTGHSYDALAAGVAWLAGEREKAEGWLKGAK